MKNITLIACTVILTFTLIASTYTSWNGQPTNNPCSKTTQEIEPPIFSYSLAPLSNNTITKESMHNAKTISDFMPDHSIQEDLKNNILSVRDVQIRIEAENVHLSKEITAKGEGNSLNKAQINLLKSVDYSTNFFLAGFLTDNLTKDTNKERYFNYHMTVVPEQQATYKDGNTAFINFLTTRCQPTIAKVQKGSLKNGMISFTVTTAGTISDIDIKSTCGYPSVDEKMVELMNEIPDAWNVATTGKGKKVNQTLVFFYGQTGC